MSSAAAVKLRCPDCGKPAGTLAAPAACPGCGRAFAPEGGVWDALPTALGEVARNEERAHAEPGLPTWRRLFFHKRYWIDWCETRWLPPLLDAGTRSLLEVGGGLCYASALAKARAPWAFVVASDVSPGYLRHHAVAVGRIIGSPADAYVAADAESLPFEDGQFDAVYSQVVLYRLPNPVRALREIRRVLARGGRYVGIERASPWARPFWAREARVMATRSREGGLAERPLRYAEWQVLLAEAGFEPGALSVVPGHRVHSSRLRRLGNAARPVYVMIRLGA